VQLVHATRPEILVIDLSMPGDVLVAINAVARRYPETKVVVFTAYANTDLALKAFDAGASGFVLKGRPIEDLYAAFAEALEGRRFVSPGFADRLAADLEKHVAAKPRQPPRLSARERELVQGLLEGKSNREIAASLNLTEKTIKHYMTNLMVKLQVKSRLEVVRAARAILVASDGLLPVDEGR